MVTDDATLSLLVRLRNHGGVGNEAADLIEWFIDTRAAERSAGEDFVIRHDPETGLGVIYTDPSMIGHIVRARDTGRRVPK